MLECDFRRREVLQRAVWSTLVVVEWLGRDQRTRYGQVIEPVVDKDKGLAQ
jgi:hypothetical protein